MATDLTEFADGFVAFMSAPVHHDPATVTADVAVLGIPHGVPYDVRGVASGASDAPHAIRQRSARFGRMLDHYDFDLGGTLFADRRVEIVDCGDVRADPRDIAGNAERATKAVRALLESGAVPIVLGGDDSVPALAVRAYQDRGPLHVVQFDAHLDFRDEVQGIRDGYSSPMRRVTEMDWVARVTHVGLRGLGSARPEDVEASRAAGNLLIRACDVHEHSPDWVVEQIPQGANCFITLDCDGLDPSVMPGTSAPLPGGLTFDEAAGIVRGLAAHTRIVGMDVAEHYPSLDVNELTSLAITRLIANLLGAMVRSGQLGH